MIRIVPLHRGQTRGSVAYHSDPKTCEVMLDRAINGLKRFKESRGTEKYHEIMSLFASGNQQFDEIIERLVRKADDVDFFDKLLRDWVLAILKNERVEQEAFAETMATVGKQINGIPDL